VEVAWEHSACWYHESAKESTRVEESLSPCRKFLTKKVSTFDELIESLIDVGAICS